MSESDTEPGGLPGPETASAPTSLPAGPVPGGRPGEVERATALSGELSGQGVHGVVLAYVDTAGIGRVKTVPTAKLASAAAWGVGMSPVFDTFLANDAIVATDVLVSPDGDLRLYPDLDRLAVLAAQPGWAWAPVDRITQEGAPHPACGRTVLRRIVARAAERHGVTFKAAIEIEWAVGRGDAPEGDFVPAVTGPAYGATRQVELSDCAADLLAALAAQGWTWSSSIPSTRPGSSRSRWGRSTRWRRPTAACWCGRRSGRWPSGTGCGSPSPRRCWGGASATAGTSTSPPGGTGRTCTPVARAGTA